MPTTKWADLKHRDGRAGVMVNTYPHMCRDAHDEVGFRGDDERCPACRIRDAMIYTQDEANDLLRACHDTWRELAAVAGLALWVNNVWSGDGLRVGHRKPMHERMMELRALGWEAPDA